MRRVTLDRKRTVLGKQDRTAIRVRVGRERIEACFDIGGRG